MPELQWEAEEDPDWGHKHEEQEKSKHSPRGPVELNRKTGLAGFFHSKNFTSFSRGGIFSSLLISASTLSIDSYFGINAEIGIDSTHSHSQPYSQ